MDISAPLARSRQAFPDPTGPDAYPTLLAVVTGDIARITRDAEGNYDQLDIVEIGVELGNLVLSSLRWLEDLGLDPAEVLAAAAERQVAYAVRQRVVRDCP